MKICSGEFDDNTDGNVSRCQPTRGCGLSGCPDLQARQRRRDQELGRAIAATYDVLIVDDPHEARDEMTQERRQKIEEWMRSDVGRQSSAATTMTWNQFGQIGVGRFEGTNARLKLKVGDDELTFYVGCAQREMSEDLLAQFSAELERQISSSRRREAQKRNPHCPYPTTHASDCDCDGAGGDR